MKLKWEKFADKSMDATGTSLFYAIYPFGSGVKLVIGPTNPKSKLEKVVEYYKSVFDAKERANFVENG